MSLSLQEYIKDKTIEDIFGDLSVLSRPLLREIIDYFNEEPPIDLISTEIVPAICSHHNDDICLKCWMTHGNDHKCYTYDRIFSESVFFQYYQLYDVLYINKYFNFKYDEYTPKPQRYSYGLDEHLAHKTYIRIGKKWFTRACLDCPLLREISDDYILFRHCY